MDGLQEICLYVEYEKGGRGCGSWRVSAIFGSFLAKQSVENVRNSKASVESSSKYFENLNFANGASKYVRISSFSDYVSTYSL